MLNLFILLLERVGLIIIIAYILMNINHFKTMMNQRDKRSSQWQLIIIFGCFSMISNFTGIQINGNEVVNGSVYNHLDPEASLANTRVLTIGVSGLIGGPFVAIFVAIISGIYRVYIGGADAYIYLISSIFIALVSGYFGYRAMSARQYPTIVKGTIIGGTTEVIQMICILIFSDNTEHAWSLVKLIALPMISINSIGTAIFLSIILSTIKQEEETRAIQTHDVLQLANETLPFFRSGLNEHSAKQAATIILDLMRVSAVAITNRKDILTHVGAASDHHVAQKQIITNLSKQAIQAGTLKEAYSREDIGCNHPECPLEAAIVVPLRVKNDVIGTLKLYFTNRHDVSHSDKQLASGLAEIFSSQLELGQAETQSALVRDAEIKSLQAQVNPHFFFNAINTISALVRIDSEKARKLLLQLSQFFRSNLQGARNNTISLEKELQQVEAYLSLEQARYPDRFDVSFNIEDSCYGALVPPFAIQILIENAIKHAFKNRKYNNRIIVTAYKTADGLYISVEDNGSGIPDDKINNIGNTRVYSDLGTGSALENLNHRLEGLFGITAKMHIHSSKEGTNVSYTIPFFIREDEKH